MNPGRDPRRLGLCLSRPPAPPRVHGDDVDDVDARILTARLSPRELETLDYLADGMTNAEIAEAMGITVQTVKTRLTLIYAELGVTRGRLEAGLAWARRRAVVTTHHHPGDDDPH